MFSRTEKWNENKTVFQKKKKKNSCLCLPPAHSHPLGKNGLTLVYRGNCIQFLALLLCWKDERLSLLITEIPSLSFFDWSECCSHRTRSLLSHTYSREGEAKSGNHTKKGTKFCLSPITFFQSSQSTIILLFLLSLWRLWVSANCSAFFHSLEEKESDWDWCIVPMEGRREGPHSSEGNNYCYVCTEEEKKLSMRKGGGRMESLFLQCLFWKR